MEFNVFLITIGALLALAFIGIGVIIGDVNRNNKGQSLPDSDVRLYVYSRYRDRGSDKRGDKPDDKEIEDVLYTLRIGASNREKRVIDYLIDEKGVKNEE